MTLTEYFHTYSSDCSQGSANQVLTHYDVPREVTGRTYYRLTHGGTFYSFLFSGQIDSTFGDGGLSVANDAAKPFTLCEVKVGLCRERGAQPLNWKTLTFDGKKEKNVTDPAPFASDPVPLFAKAGDWLCYQVTLYGDCFPYHQELNACSEIRKDDGTWSEQKKFTVPLMIGSDRPVQKRVAFIGDSITQGLGTYPDSYTHWVAKIEEQLPETVSVWDLGIGFARGQDAATDGGWLFRAKQCDTVGVCFGVNDIEWGRNETQLLGDLKTTLTALKQAGCRTILFTVPPFDMTGEHGRIWYAVNHAIREEGTASMGADAVFDFAKVLGQDEPNAHLARYGGHPNAEGCLAAAQAFLAGNLL